MATQLHCAYCFDCVIEACSDDTVISDRLIYDEIHTTEEYPLFITWKQKSRYSSEYKLRGCIGTFVSHKLCDGLQQYAITSALHDSRFSPIKFNDIQSLRCDVSLLINFTYNLDAYDWIIGQHGITIQFNDGVSNNNNRVYSATYLPEVAPEQGWTKDQTLHELVYKSGYRRKITQELINNIKLTRFESSKASCTYEEYIKIKHKLNIKHNNNDMN